MAKKKTATALTAQQRDELKDHIARWMHHKTSQWEQERQIEKILGREINDFSFLEHACVGMDTEMVCEARQIVSEYGDEMIEDLLS